MHKKSTNNTINEWLINRFVLGIFRPSFNGQNCFTLLPVRTIPLPIMKKTSWIVCSVLLALFLLIKWQMPERLAPQIPSAKEHAKALIGGPFELIDQSGKPFTDKDLLGKYSLIYFGFTYCPDICPTSLLIISNALRELGPDAAQIKPIFISLDPERDTPETLKDYVSHFDDHLIGLTGTLEQVKQAADAYKVYFQKVPQPDSAVEYLIDHSGFIFLMDPEGHYVTHYTHDVTEQKLEQSLRNELKR